MDLKLNKGKLSIRAKQLASKGRVIPSPIDNERDKERYKERF